MSTFREYLEQREMARAEQAKALARSRATKFTAEEFLKMHAAHEWSTVQKELWALVQDQEVSGHRFFRREGAVGLGAVLVSFMSQATHPSASPCLFGLVFSQDGGEATDKGRPPVLAPEHWKIRAAVSEGDIFWTRADVPCRHPETAVTLANRIATRLVEYFDKYERATGHDELFVGNVATPQRG